MEEKLYTGVNKDKTLVDNKEPDSDKINSGTHDIEKAKKPKKAKEIKCNFCGVTIENIELDYCAKCGAGLAAMKSNEGKLFKGYTKNVIFALLIMIPCLFVPSLMILSWNERAKDAFRQAQYEKFRDYKRRIGSTFKVCLGWMMAIVFFTFLFQILQHFRV